MIKEIVFSNYRAFEKGAIEIKPITILLGANSAGKSSIMQLLLMLQQTAECEDDYKSALKLNGRWVGLGESLNLLRGKDSKSKLSIKMSFDDEFLRSEIQDEIKKCYYDLANIYSFCAREREQERSKIRKSSIIKTSFNYKNYLFGNSEFFIKEDVEFVNKLIDRCNTVLGSVFDKRNENDIAYHFFNSNVEILDLIKSVDHLKKLFVFLDMLKKRKIEQNFDVEFVLSLSTEKVFIIDSVLIKNNNRMLFTICLSGDNNNLLLHDDDNSLVINRILLEKDVFVASNTIFSFVNNRCKRDKKYIKPDVRFSMRIVEAILKRIKSCFDDKLINYVSPLRAHPKRYYFLDKANHSKSLDTLDGDALTEILKYNYLLRTQVNSWFRKFGISLEVSTMKDIIHQLVVKQNSLSLDITDVGFGISQVLPVIIQGFLSVPNSLTLIEQPEIHLHPTMQADLADLFIDIVSTNLDTQEKYLLIETHSEYLLKRLQRRISEGRISAEDVAIYFIDPQSEGQSAHIDRLKIQDKGYFEWPKDFYSGELLNDTLVFLKNQ